MSPKRFQDDLKQYQMPESVKKAKKGTYQVGYENSTGNRTSPDHEIGKKI
jgi:hypothetical protein